MNNGVPRQQGSPRDVIVSLVLAALSMTCLILAASHVVLWDLSAFRRRVESLISIDFSADPVPPLESRHEDVSAGESASRVMESSDAPLFGQQPGQLAEAPKPLVDEIAPAMPTLEKLTELTAREVWTQPPKLTVLQQSIRSQQVRAQAPISVRRIPKPEATPAADAALVGAFRIAAQLPKSDAPGGQIGQGGEADLFRAADRPGAPTTDNLPIGDAPSPVLPPSDPQSMLMQSLAPVSTPVALPALSDQISSRVETYSPPGRDDLFFRIVLKPKPSVKMQRQPRDILFLVDISQSIPRDELAAVRATVLSTVRNLPAEDRWNIVVFSEQPDSLATGYRFRNASQYNARQIQSFIARRKGWRTTDVYEATQLILGKIPQGTRPCTVILFSDGKANQGPSDVRRIVHDFRRVQRARFSIYTYDLGKAGNQALLRLLAYRSRGAFGHSPQVEGAAVEMLRFLQQIRHPLLSNCVVSYTDINAQDVFPAVLPNLYRDQDLTFYGKARLGETVAFRLVGTGPNGQRMEYFFRDTMQAPRGMGDRSIMQDWAEWKARALLSDLVDAPADRARRAAFFQHLNAYQLPRDAWLGLLPEEVQ